jgi:hypothetical protein
MKRRICRLIHLVSVMVLFLGPSTIDAQDQRPPSVEDAWRFLCLADWHSAEKFIFADRYPRLEAAINEDIATLKRIKRDFAGELIILPGDSNEGQWDTAKFIKKFNPELTVEQSISQAGKLCYEGMIDTFKKGGYDTLLMAVGDHEVGNDPWPVGSDVSRYQHQFREAFARAFNYSADGSSFKYRQKIGSANSRPRGTKYQDTSYAYQHKNVLFITIDVFHQQDPNTRLGEKGSVIGTVVDAHLEWLESVLSEARKDPSIKHIFVQSHLPVIYPVRKVLTSGMLIDKGLESEFWKLMRKYNVDIYFAGEVHANTVTKDPHSDLLQVVTRGNFFTNFQTVDVSDDKIEMTLYRHFGEKTSDGNYQVAGKLSVDKSGRDTSINATGELALLDPQSKLLQFDFEEDFAEIDRPVNGLSEKKNSYVLDGKRTHRVFANSGSFGSQYDALHYNVEIVPGKNGNAGKFSTDSRMAVFAMGPLQNGHAIAYALSFKTQSKNNQILINTATIWGQRPRNFLNLYLDDGLATVAISDTQTLQVKSKRLNDDQWHRIKVSMPHSHCKLSQLIVEVDGQVMEASQISGDAQLRFSQSMRFTVGGKGYSGESLKGLGLQNFSGLIDDVSLWSLGTNIPGQAAESGGVAKIRFLITALAFIVCVALFTRLRRNHGAILDRRLGCGQGQSAQK